MNPDAVALSCLLDGDLPEDEVRALRARLEREPALRALWQTMQSLPTELSSLPDIPGERRPRPPRRWAFWGGGLALAATVAFVLGRLSAPLATVRLPGTDVVLHGDAAIALTPLEDPAMNRSFLAGGLTVGLLSGTAWLVRSPADPVRLEVGEPVALATPAPPRLP
ncbi:MAG: hypothetical protein AAF211_23025, partial [Myxococcota bacterium]